MGELDFSEKYKKTVSLNLEKQVLDFFYKMFHNKAKADKLFQAFSRNIQKLLTQILLNYNEKDKPTLTKTVHSLKGVLMTGGLKREGFFAKNIEDELTNYDDNIEWNEIKEEIDNLFKLITE